ncbi:MAG: hypothetical protein ACKOAU_04245 [Pirellula sp.]
MSSSKQVRRLDSLGGKYERRGEQLASMQSFLGRLFRAFLATLVIVSVSLAIGTFGYSYFLGVPLIDGLINAAMILTGMGPVDRMESTAGKLFATFYALYSGLAFLSMVAIIIAPVYHRFLHLFHLDEESGQ